MSHCHHHNHNLYNILDLFGIEGSGLVVSVFLTGLAISLSHCIGMCGPFALMQLNLRLMPLRKEELSQGKKFRLALFMPYYLGKGLTYCVLMSVLYYTSHLLTNTFWFRQVALLFIFLTACFFLKEAWVQVFPQFIRPFFTLPRKIEQIIMRFKPAESGLYTGLVLGLIPCGALYAILASIVALSANWFVALAATMMFALATIPGLFISAYLGEYCMNKSRKYFSWLYAIMMLVNAGLLLHYMSKLI